MNRENSIKRAGIFGIAGNLFLFIIKGTVGFITHSQAMIADAANSAGDIFSSSMTFIGNKIANIYFSIINNKFNFIPNSTSAKFNVIPIASITNTNT